MPELPEVESFKRYFENTSLNKKIAGIECGSKKLIKGMGFGDFEKRLKGRSFREASRRGKFLIADIEGGREKLIMHFGMTGGLNYVRQGRKACAEERFSRLTFEFDNGDKLHWLNMRKLGKVYLVKDPAEVRLIGEMGPEPLGLSGADFFGLLNRHGPKNMKAFFLDQRGIAGIGNIYSDEILFQARISPSRAIGSLNFYEKSGIYQAMTKVLRKAIRITSASGTFGHSWLLSHRGKDTTCPRNKNHLTKREMIAGRTAVYCPTCQR